MGRRSSKSHHPEVPGCFNGIWSALEAEDTTTPVVARKSLSERKFSEGFEAPRNSLDIVFERQNSAAHGDEIPFGFEFALRRSSSERMQQPPRLTIPSPGTYTNTNTEPKCRSPSVIARLMGLDTLPASDKEQKSSPKAPQAWNLMSERFDFTNIQKQQHFSRQLSSNASVPHSAPLVPFSAPASVARKYHQEDELLLFDVLPFREEHPQEKQLQKLKDEFKSRKAQLEELKEELMLKQVHIQRMQLDHPNSLPRSVSAPKVSRVSSKETSTNMLEAIQFLQSNKDLLVKFLQEPDSAFSRHVYDLQALAAKEASLDENINVSKSHKDNTPSSRTGFSRKLNQEVPQKQCRDDDGGSRIVLLKPSVRKSSRTSSRESSPLPQVDQSRKSRNLTKDVDASTDPKELAREIIRHVRKEQHESERSASKMVFEQSTTSSSGSPRPWSLTRQATGGGGEGSEPSSRRYTTKDNPVSSSSASTPTSPRLSNKIKSNVSSKEGRKQLLEKLKMTASEEHKDESNVEVAGSTTKQAVDRKMHKGNKLSKLFNKESTDVSPRHLVRSKSASSLAEEKTRGGEQVLERTHSCKTGTEKSSSATTSSKGKLSSLKSSLLGKKKSSKTCPTSEKCPDDRVGRKPENHKEDAAPTTSDHQTGYPDKIALDNQSPRFLTLELDAGSDVHKSEQPSPVSVLERAFLEESPSPVSFEDASSDLQELQMRLERLKLDESGRTWNIGQSKETTVYDQEMLTPRQTSSSNSTCSGSPASFDGDEDQIYIKKLLDASGFSHSVQSLMNWYSPSCPMDPCLFAKLEEQYSDPQLPSHWQTGIKRHGSRAQRKLKIGRSSVNEVQRRPETLHRQMIFDVVNEVLSKKFQNLWNDEPWLKMEGIRPIPSGKNLLHEVCREVSLYQHEYESREYPLENLVERDVNRSDQWMDVRSEVHRVTSKLEADIFNRLIEEILASF